MIQQMCNYCPEDNLNQAIKQPTIDRIPRSTSACIPRISDSIPQIELRLSPILQYSQVQARLGQSVHIHAYKLLYCSQSFIRCSRSTRLYSNRVRGTFKQFIHTHILSTAKEFSRQFSNKYDKSEQDMTAISA
jgi:hypothetical protein